MVSPSISIRFLPTISTYFPRVTLEISPPMTYIPAASPASVEEAPKVLMAKPVMLMRSVK